MTTTVPVQCPSCQKSYNAPRERAGARFKCKQCGDTLTVPHAPEEPARPVVMPSQSAGRPVVQPSRPVVAPSAAPERPVVPPVSPPERPVVSPSSAPGRPVVKPATVQERPAVKPAPVSERPVVAPSAAPERPAAPPPRPRRVVPRGETPARATEGAPPKSRLTLVLLAIGGFVLLAVGGFFALSGEDGEKTERPENTVAQPGEPPPAPKPVFDAAKRAAELRSETGTQSADQLWSLVERLGAEAAAWREKGAPQDAVDTLAHEKDVALEDLVRMAPDHAQARKARDEVKYAAELDEFGNAPYLNDLEIDQVRRMAAAMKVLAADNGGWISRNSFETQIQPLLTKCKAAREAHEELASSPFGRAAKELEVNTSADLAQKLGGTAAFRAFVHKPYVLFVEENPGWSPHAEAKSLFSPLKAILEAFLKEFASQGLQPLDVPVPVVYFMSEKRYEEYNKAIGNTGIPALAHYEPGNGRLVLNRGVTHETIIHEGTHQIFDKYTKNMLPHPRQSFWFQEGIAEWFGGSNRLQAPDGSWMYETGVLLDGRLDSWRALESGEFPLKELLEQTYAKRNTYIGTPGGQSKIGLVYAQGWFLIYFLNHFDVAPDGMVRIGVKGRYADGWNKYLEAELSGRTGKKVFMECLNVDDAALDRMDKEYNDYFEFVMRKRNLGQVREKKLIPWDEYVNKVGKKTGEKEDDLLIAPPRGQ